MLPDGGDQQVIFDRSVADVVYSPDGQRIAFTRLTGGNLIPSSLGIHSDGSHLTRLVSISTRGQYYASPRGSRSPAERAPAKG